jgi:prephenate dehydrogenase/prephenate dehydratase
MAGILAAYPEGFSLLAEKALKAFSLKAKSNALQTIDAVFKAVTSNQAACGVIPVENVITGRYAQTLDSLLKYRGSISIIDSTIVSSGITDDGREDKTRFILIGKGETTASGKDVTSLAIYPKRDRVKLLYDMIQIISVRYNLNMTDIDRRPDKKGLSIFFIDIEGHISDEKVNACIDDIRTTLSDTDVIVLGSYPYQPFNEPLIKSIGIIGGTGEMGTFFIPFFESLGYKISVAGRKTPVTHEECARNNDAVIVNVPIDRTEEIIKKIAPLMKKGQLLIDNTGIKTKAVKAMLNFAPEGVEVLSIHTMFGPGTERLMGENIISIPTQRSGPMAQEFEDLLFKHGANITRTTPEQHDRFVTMTQGLEHIDSVAKLSTILEIAGNPDALQPFSTPNSRKSAEIWDRIHTQDPNLYTTMLRENPFMLDTLKAYLSNLSSIISSLENDEAKAFEKAFLENAEKIKH